MIKLTKTSILPNCQMQNSFFGIKIIYSEKATTFCEIFLLLLTTEHTVKSKGKISQNFVAFSEYLNFNCKFYNSKTALSACDRSRDSKSQKKLFKGHVEKIGKIKTILQRKLKFVKCVNRNLVSVQFQTL